MLYRTGVPSTAGEMLGEEKYRFIRECGFDCIDYRMINTKDDVLYSCDFDEFCARLAKERELIEGAGLKVWQVHGPWQWPITDGRRGGREERLEKMSRSIRGAAILDAPFWVVHPFMPHGISDKKSGKTEQTRAANVSFFKELLKVADEVGVTICLENMPFPDFSLSTPEEIMSIVREINHPNFKMCLDTGHLTVFEGWTPARAMREYHRDIATLHVHDNDGKSDTHRCVYYGVIDWSDFGNAIKEVGWDGVISLETSPSAGLPCEIYRKMLKLYREIAASIV